MFKVFQLVLFFLILSAVTVFAAVDEVGQNPTPINQWDISGGYGKDYEADKESFYYKIQYRGTLVKQKGTPFVYANPNIPIPEPNAKDPGGDKNAFAARLEHGTVALKGGIFEFLGTKEFLLPKPLSSLRGAAEINGRLDGEQINVGVGVETPPIHFLQFLNNNGAGITNWLILGVSGQHQIKSKELGDDKDVPIASYRAFAGRGFFWKKAANTEAAATKLADAVLEKAPTNAVAKALLPSISASIAGDAPVSNAERVIHAIATDSAAEADWEKGVREYVRGFYDASSNPTIALWLEASGWYNVNEVALEKRMNNLFSATGRWWLVPEEKDRLYLEVRYEIGREKASPTVKKEILILSAGMNF